MADAGSPNGPVSPESLVTAMACLFDQSEAVVSLFDNQDRLIYGNARYYDLICHTLGTYPTWSDIVRDNHARGQGLIVDTDDVEDWIAAALQKRRAQNYRQFEIDAWDGRWLLMTETLLPDLGLLGMGVDITQAVNSSSKLKQEYRHAVARSETDLLTGLGNRRSLERLLELLISRGRHHQVTALMIDIDQFKPYNDTLGHLQGDLCLEQVSAIIRNSLRLNDAYPIRLGGDEFLVLMLDVDGPLAQQVARRILHNVRNSAIPHPSSESGRVTFSIGLASGKILDSESFASLLQDADDALYEAKRRGRDGIHGL